MDRDTLPSCGLYRTRETIGSVPAGRLVYFHNHGEPGPGVYLPDGWNTNRAQFRREGVPLASPEDARHLEPLPPEGLYRVLEAFPCCARRCRTFEEGLLVQLGYDGAARPILFVPEWTDAGLAFPKVGQPVDETGLERIAPLKVPRGRAPESDTRH